MLITSCRLLLTRWSSSCSRISRCSTAARRLPSIRWRSIAMPSRLAAPCRKAMSCSPNSPSDAAVDLEHAVGGAVALQDHVHGAADAVLDQQLGRAEALLVLEMVRDHGLAGAQREAGRRGEVGADAGLADDARRPADPGSDQQPVLGRQVLQHLGRTRRAGPRRRTGRSGRAARGTGVPLSASTPSSARSSCWRTRWRSSRRLGSVRLLAVGRLLDHRLAAIVRIGQGRLLR